MTRRQASHLPAYGGRRFDVPSRPVEQAINAALWTASGTSTVTVDLTDTTHGAAYRLTANGNTDFLRPTVLDLRNRSLTFWCKLLDGNLTDLNIYLYLTREFGGGGPVLQRRPIYTDMSVGRWHHIITPPVAMEPYGAAVVDWTTMLEDVRDIQVFVGTGTTTELLMADLRVHDNPLAPGVVWNFDDARADTYTVAFPEFESRGIVGSICVPSGKVGAAGTMTLAQLHEMRDAGWEMVGHSETHADLTTLTLDQLRLELRNSRNWLVDNGFGKGARFHAYPYNAWNTQVISETQRYYQIGRVAGSLVGPNNLPSPIAQHPGVHDPGLVRFRSISGSNTVADLTAWLDRALTGAGIVCLMFHSIVDVVSDITVEFELVKLRQVLDHANSIGLRSYVPSDLWGT